MEAAIETPTLPEPTPIVETPTPEVETKPEGAEAEKPKEEQKDDPKFARRFAALSRQEKQIQEKQKAVEDKEKQLEAMRTEAEEVKAVLAMAKENPLEFLKKTGLDYNELTNLVLSSELSEEDKKFKTLEKEIEELKQSKEREKQEQEAAKLKAQEERFVSLINNYKVECKNTVQQNPDKYELILANGREDDVFDIIERYFVETETVLDFDIAADYLEQILFEEAQKIVKTKKFASAFQPKEAEAMREKATDVREKQRPSPTLTNSKMSGSVGQPSGIPMTDRERFNRAVAKLEGK